MPSVGKPVRHQVLQSQVNHAIGGTEPPVDTVSTVIPRIRGLSYDLRRQQSTTLSGLQGLTQTSEEEPAPARSGLVGMLQDIEDDLRLAISLGEDCRNILN